MTVGTVTADVFVECLKDQGLRFDALLMVHASLKSFGHFEGGADAVIDALTDVVSAGTIDADIHPAFTQTLSRA